MMEASVCSSEDSTPDPELRRASSPSPSGVSMKSDQSMGRPIDISSGAEHDILENELGRASSPPPSYVSMKSNWSMVEPMDISNGAEEGIMKAKLGRASSPPPSYVSMKSNWSMVEPMDISNGAEEGIMKAKHLSIHKSPKTHKVVECTEEQHMDDVLHKVLERHKASMKLKYESLFEGVKSQESRTLLNRIFTQLYIIERESEGVNEEHEVLQIAKRPSKPYLDYLHQIDCLDIFKLITCSAGEGAERDVTSVMAKDVRPEMREEDKGLNVPDIKTVLTKGIAGIGKTVSVQKFILDWAERKANQEISFMFALPFRQLNLIKDDQYSLHELLCDFHPELKDLDLKMYDKCKVVFIFDGLDESKIPLNILHHEKISDITMTSSVGVLISNLIKGELLPHAHIWITCRPAAANQIPCRYINRVTEIQGFSDPQKEEYFRKRISDQDQAQKIISYMKTTRSLHIMCHIPVFCWISATVLQQVMKKDYTKIPKTLTEMYIHFLITVTCMKIEKYNVNNKNDLHQSLESNRDMILKLAELAFKQLMKGNVMFYEEDLRDCGIDATEASVYSGICTEMFVEEPILYQKKVYCFVHLSFQEFLAAYYVFHCYLTKNTEALNVFVPLYRWCPEIMPLEELLKGAVDKALESKNGHLDLFLRFLIGISLESNQRLLQGLLTHGEHSSSESMKSIIRYIKIKVESVREDDSTERVINLFLCLTEINDQSLSSDFQKQLYSEQHSDVKLSPGQCSALACMLLVSEEVLDEFVLRKYNTSLEGYRRLLPAVTYCRKAILSWCNLTPNFCEMLAHTLQSADCPLKELDLSSNDLQDSGVEQISAGLKSSHCKLEILKLAMCNLGEKACENLGSVLQSGNCLLKELDLSNNDLQDSGVKLLSAGLKSLQCALEVLRLSGCLVTEEGCSYLASALSLTSSHLRELDLTYNHPGDLGLKLLSDRQKDSHCKLDILKVDHAGEIRMKSGLKKYTCEVTVDPNTVPLNFCLSEGDKRVKSVEEQQPYPDHPERFDYYAQMMCKQSLSGHCYWEAECCGEVSVAMIYKGIPRKGANILNKFGFSEKSWRLMCTGNRCVAIHDEKKVPVHVLSSGSNRVGVYLDWSAGTLSFYKVLPDTDKLIHLYTFHATFTEPLYAGFYVYSGGSVRVCV